MSNISIEETYQPKLSVCKNNIYYDFNINESINHGVYVNYKYEMIDDIMFAIKSYYIEQLSSKLDLNEDEFIFNFNIYKETICKHYIAILDLYNRTDKKRKTIDDKIQKLIDKPLKYIVYESSWCNEELLLPQMLRINDILNRNISLERILYDIYEYEVSLINNKLPNITIEINGELLYLVEYNDIEYKNTDNIMNIIIEDFKHNILKMEKLKEIFSFKIYEHICMYKNVDENKIVSLYQCLGIDYVKIIIDMNDYNVAWIMRKLNMMLNNFIPTIMIDNKLNDIINQNIEDKIINIKYNKDATTAQQLTKYLIDKLYNSLMESENNKKY
jgi:hypothetical protein